MHHTACQSASHLACTHPLLGGLIPILLILLVLAGSATAAYCAKSNA